MPRPNFDDRQSTAVREYFVANVTHWISEFHFDGLRIDATQAFEDDSAESILVALCRAARQAAPEPPGVDRGRKRTAKR